MAAGLARFRRRGDGSATDYARPEPFTNNGQGRAVPAIEFCDVHLWFDDHKVIDGLSFKVMRGETKIVLGGSGGGKSTIIKLVLGLLKPDAGRTHMIQDFRKNPKKYLTIKLDLF